MIAGRIGPATPPRRSLPLAACLSWAVFFVLILSVFSLAGCTMTPRVTGSASGPGWTVSGDTCPQCGQPVSGLHLTDKAAH